LIADRPSGEKPLPSKITGSNAKMSGKTGGLEVSTSIFVSAFAPIWAVALFLLFVPAKASAYSVLAHEAVIDASWDAAIKPLLLARYPGSTPEQLAEARSYAYGGSIIQDLGYYPFGSFFFTNLLHYVRSADFVETLLREAQTEDEYAFALGAMAHFFGDTLGHPLGVNPSVAIRYPKLRKKYGAVVTFEEGKKQHLLVEFSFDVIEDASKAYAPQAYHDFIGFQVARPLLERAFKDTYGLEMKDVFFNENLALGTYRRGVSKTIPHMTRVAWAQKHDEIEKLIPGVQRNRFIYRMTRRQYEAEFGKEYREPSFEARFLAFILNFVPKIAFFRFLSFQPPTPRMTTLFQQSFQTVTERYTAAVRRLNSGNAPLSNEDLDTGDPSLPGEYGLADQTYAELLDRLADRNFADVPAEATADILDFYSKGINDPPRSKKERKRWEKTQKELSQLRQTVAKE
jgi:Zinc dependent phospholipase C